MVKVDITGTDNLVWYNPEPTMWAEQQEDDWLDWAEYEGKLWGWRWEDVHGE